MDLDLSQTLYRNLTTTKKKKRLFSPIQIARLEKLGIEVCVCVCACVCVVMVCVCACVVMVVNVSCTSAGRHLILFPSDLCVLLTHSPTHSLIHTHTHSLTRCLTHTLTHTLTPRVATPRT